MRNVVKFTDYKQYHTTARIIYNGQDITDNKDPNNKDPKKDQDKTIPPQTPHD